MWSRLFFPVIVWLVFALIWPSRFGSRVLNIKVEQSLSVAGSFATKCQPGTCWATLNSRCFVAFPRPTQLFNNTSASSIPTTPSLWVPLPPPPPLPPYAHTPQSTTKTSISILFPLSFHQSRFTSHLTTQNDHCSWWIGLTQWVECFT